jgi:hypothetical protein
MDKESSIKLISEVLEAVRIHRRLMKSKSDTTSKVVSALFLTKPSNIRCLTTMIMTTTTTTLLLLLLLTSLVEYKISLG